MITEVYQNVICVHILTPSIPLQTSALTVLEVLRIPTPSWSLHAVTKPWTVLGSNLGSRFDSTSMTLGLQQTINSLLVNGTGLLKLRLPYFRRTGIFCPIVVPVMLISPLLPWMAIDKQDGYLVISWFSWLALI